MSPFLFSSLGAPKIANGMQNVIGCQWRIFVDMSENRGYGKDVKL